MPASATASAQRSPVYAASGIGAGVQVDGTPVSTWGDSSPDGGGYRVGVGTNGADQEFSAACCEIDPNVGADAVSGETMIAANLIDSGIQVRSLATNSITTVPDSTAAWTQQRTSISGRFGAPGVHVAYGRGTNMFDAVPSIWQVGASTFKFFPKQSEAEHVGLAPAPEGRIWLYWNRGLTLYATRSNRDVTRFGSIVSPRRTSGRPRSSA